MRERSIRWPCPRAISSTQRSTAESIPSPSRSIFRKPASAQESLSHWTICRPSIAAGTTGQQSISGLVAMIIPPECWERWRGRPCASSTSRHSQLQRSERRSRTPSDGSSALACGDGRVDVVLGARSEPVGAAGDPLDLPGRQAQHLPQLADRSPHAEGREGGDQRRTIVAEAVVHARDQPLADVPGEVEVDVGQPVQVLVQEAPQRQPVGDRVDVGEPGQVADQRGDRGSPPAAREPASPAPSPGRAPPGRPRGRARASRGGAGRSPPARAGRSPAAPAPGATGASPRVGPRLARRASAVALLQARRAQLRPGAGRRPAPRPPDSGSRDPSSDRISAARPAAASPAPPRDGRRSGWPSPAACSSRGCCCRGAAARRRPAWCDGAKPRRRPAARPCSPHAHGRRRSPRISRPAAGPPRRTPGCGPGRGGRRAAAAPRRGSPCRTPRAASRPSADPPARRSPIALRIPSGRPGPRHARRRPPRRSEGSPSSRRPGPSRVWAWARVRIRQRLLQPRSSRTSSVTCGPGGSGPCRRAGRDPGRPAPDRQVDLGAVDRPHPVLGRGLGQLHRAGDRVVVGQRQRRVPQLACPLGQLLGQRDAVQEGVGRMAVQLGVWKRTVHQGPCTNQRPVHRSWKTTRLRPRIPISSQ